MDFLKKSLIGAVIGSVGMLLYAGFGTLMGST